MPEAPGRPPRTPPETTAWLDQLEADLVASGDPQRFARLIMRSRAGSHRALRQLRKLVRLLALLEQTER